MQSNNKKFLTVFAVFDDNTQYKLNMLKQIISHNNIVGNMITDIPFHISLGSYPLDMKEELINKIKEIATIENSFEINLQKIQHFDNKVLFVKPRKNDNLIELQKNFDNNFADKYKFYPHVTLFCGDKKQVKIVKRLIKNVFESFTGYITSLYIGEFYPTQIIYHEELQSNQQNILQ